MKNFLQSTQSTDQSIRDLSHLIYRIEAHIYRGELGPASALLASVEGEVVQLEDSLTFPLSTIIVGSQLGFLSGGKLRGRVSGALVGGLIGWLYGQQASSDTRRDLEVIHSRIEDLKNLLAVQARRLADEFID